MAPPLCSKLGRQCRALDVTLRVAALEGEEDHEATWLFGHTERIDFGRKFIEDEELWSEATIHVPCKHLKLNEDGQTGHCSAHGFSGRVPVPRRTPAPRKLGKNRFKIFEGRREVTRNLPPPVAPPVKRGSLPVVNGANPCATAACKTSDGTQKAACCRDIHTDIRCTPRQTHLESLIRNRKAPYLCKAHREEGEENVLVVEIISACDYLKEDGIYCDLHGRERQDGTPAKPLMCSAWPESRSGLHPGCAFRNRRLAL